MLRRAAKHTHTHACTLLPSIASPIGGYSTLAMQPYMYLCKVHLPTKYIILVFSFEGNSEYSGACQRKKMHRRQNLALPDMVHSQEMEQPYININSGMLVSTQSSLSLCTLFRYTGEKERGSGSAYFCSILPYSIGHLPR